MSKKGRPDNYTEELGDKICELLALGKSLRSICDIDEMPSQPAVYRWIQKYEDFRKKYAHAREKQAETLFDEMLDIADDGYNDWMTNKHGDEITNREAIERSKLRIEARKWMLGKLKPKKYGDKVEVEHSGEITNKHIEIVTKDDLKPDDIGYIEPDAD